MNEHLFAIADIAGGHWPDKAKQAALSLSGVENEEPSQNTLLLADIRDVFDATDDTFMRSSHTSRRPAHRRIARCRLSDLSKGIHPTVWVWPNQNLASPQRGWMWGLGSC